MNTTKLSLLVLLVVGCGGSMQVAPPTDGGSDTGVITSGPLAGHWSIHMVPTDRVVTMVPPPCDGSMTISQDDSFGIAGTWMCGAGTGSLSGFHVRESGGAWIGFSAPSPITGATDQWLTAWVSSASTSSLTGDNLTASRL